MSRKKHASVAGGGVNLSYIITPFLDMSFQLLAFFIMTYHPSALEGHIDGKLVPPSDVAIHTNKPVPTNELPPDSDPDLAETFLVIIKSVAKGQQEGNRNDGEPSRILLKQPQDTTPATIADSDGTLDEGLKKLEAELKRLLKQPGAVKSNIKIEGDGDLKHMYVMRVYDVCKLSGYQNISFVAPKFQRKIVE
jgi:biopolymer transport protein ExbD